MTDFQLIAFIMCLILFMMGILGLSYEIKGTNKRMDRDIKILIDLLKKL